VGINPSCESIVARILTLNSAAPVHLS